MISIITPTYNREKFLKNIYKSLLIQEYKDFEWIVIDDGSKDNTRKLIEKYINKKEINIKYIYKENGGKPSAYNLGVVNSNGEILICLDSDDILTKNALYIISNDYSKIKEKEILAGLVYNNSKLNNPDEIIGTAIPNNVEDTYYNLYKKYNVVGDKTQVIKKDVAKKYLFPEIEGEKFVPEALINNRISQKYKFLYKNTTIKLVEYLTDGYSNNYFSLVKNNPKGNALYFKELYNLEKNLYNIYGYVLFSIYSKYTLRYILKNHKNKIMVLLMYVPVLLISKIRK